MITFNIDTHPLSLNFVDIDDYLHNFIGCFCKYPILTNGSDKTSLCSIKYKTNSIIKLELKKPFFFIDGSRLSLEDLKEFIVLQIQNNSRLKNMLSDIKTIKIKNNTLIIKHKKNRFFYRYFYNISLSPVKRSMTCGTYYLNKKTDNKIMLLPNYKNNVLAEPIEFNIIKDPVIDVKLFGLNKCHFTNTTTFLKQNIENYKNKENFNCYSSNIFFMLSFINSDLLKNENKDLRKKISSSINREEISEKLKSIVTPINKFTFNEKIYFNDMKNFNKFDLKAVNLTIGYDDFYPNELICKEVSKQLLKHNVKVTLVKTNYFEQSRSSSYDMRLDLFIPDYEDDYAFYSSSIFKQLLKNCNFKAFNMYNKIMSKIKVDENSKELLDKAIIIFHSEVPVIPLFRGKHIYLSNNKEFNFNDPNTEIFTSSRQKSTKS